MDRPGPSGISSSSPSERKRPGKEKTTESPNPKRVKRATPKSRKAVQAKKKQPVSSAVTQRTAESVSISTPKAGRRLEDIFSSMEEDKLKEAVKSQIARLSREKTLTHVVSKLNEKSSHHRTESCDSATLFEYVERQRLLEGLQLFQLMPVEVAVQRAETEPTVLNNFLLAWWKSGRSFQKVYSATKGRLPTLKVTEGTSWHPEDLIQVSPLLKRELERTDETELNNLYRGLLNKEINKTGRLLLYAHVQDRALELYFLGKLGQGVRLNEIIPILRKSQVPARICRSRQWRIVEVYRWLTSRVSPDSDIYNRLLEELPLSELKTSKPSDKNHEFLVACAIRNWVRKNESLSNIVQHFSTEYILLPEWSDAWDSRCLARLVVDHFGIQGFFPTPLEVVSADYKSTLIEERRKQLGLELLVRACAQEPGAIKNYILCRLYAGEQLREVNPESKTSRKSDCVQIAQKLNEQEIGCPLNNNGRWIAELVDQYVR